MNIVSYGGGTNSTALIIGMYQHSIPIDLIIFSDTGGEKPHTYEFIEIFSRWLEERSLPRVTKVRQTLRGNPYTLEEKLLTYNELPAPVYGNSQCAVQFKINPKASYCNKHPMCKDVWMRHEKVNEYIGYDAKEQRRIDKNKAVYETDKKYEKHFPLIAWGWGRDECINAIKDAGLPLPGKSSCFFCPNNKKDVIQQLWEDYPDLFDRAVALERNARKTKRDGTPTSIVGLGRTWTWEEYREIWMHNEEFRKSQFVLPGFEDFTGGCCCGMPCGCYDG